MEIPRDQLAALLDHGLYSSAQLLGYFLVASSSSTEGSSGLKAENLVFLGDALFKEREYRRAIHMYKQALQLCKILPKQNTQSLRSSLSSSNRSPPSSVNASVINENEVKFKVASCHCQLNEGKAALVEMEGIPYKVRLLPMHLMMGKLYRSSQHHRAAVACYKECLRFVQLEIQVSADNNLEISFVTKISGSIV
ncbi:Anaphase-promoting complex subunit 7-like protein [Drosera capensis]